MATFDPNEADEKTQKMMTEFDQLTEIYGNDSSTLHVYTWINPFDPINRPLIEVVDRHKVVYFTLDHQNFATVELCMKCINKEKYTIYPHSQHIPPNEEKIQQMEYVGSKQFSTGNLSSAPAHFVNIAVQTMLKFGGYNFFVNNCQDYVDTYLDNIGLDVSVNDRRQNTEERHPNYYTDYGKIVYFCYCLILCVFFLAMPLCILILPWQAGGPSESHQHSMPAVLQCIFMLQVAMVCLVSTTAILRSIVRRNVRIGYELFSYYVTGSELTSLATLVMICIVHMYNRNIILFCEWQSILIYWILFGDCEHPLFRSMSPIHNCVIMLQTINTIILENKSYGFPVLSWSNNPAIWILIAFPKQLSTTGQTTLRYVLCLNCLRICAAFLPAYELVYEDELLGKAENLDVHRCLEALRIISPLFCFKFVRLLV
jgi:hypothetical protein